MTTVAARAPVHVRIPCEEFRQTYLDICARPGNERLVTTIEMLSPTNKMKAGDGRPLYLQKQREVLASKVNLVEIDLLRAREHATAAFIGCVFDQESIRRSTITSLVVLSVGLMDVGIGFARSFWGQPRKSQRVR